MSEIVGNSPVIMLVEDSDDIRSMVRTALEKKGYRVVEAVNGREALDAAARESPDLVLMDIELPEVDGISIAYYLRASQQFRRIPIIAITAFDGEDYRAEALEAGCDGYITKPIDFEGLEGLIEKLLDQSAQRGEAEH